MARGFALVTGELPDFLKHRSSVKTYRAGNDGHQPEVAEGHAHAAIAEEVFGCLELVEQTITIPDCHLTGDADHSRLAKPWDQHAQSVGAEARVRVDAKQVV